MDGKKKEDGQNEERWMEGRKKMERRLRDGQNEERWMEGRKKMGRRLRNGRKEEDRWKEERR